MPEGVVDFISTYIPYFRDQSLLIGWWCQIGLLVLAKVKIEPQPDHRINTLQSIDQ